MTDLKLVPTPNPTLAAVERMERVLTDALANLDYERRSALDREDRKAYEVAMRVQGGLELLIGSLRSEK